MEELKINIPVKKVIPAIEPWFGTGFYLTKGSTYKFEVIPKTQTWKDGKLLNPFTADGRMLPHLIGLYPFIRMPFVKWFALLGCINKNRKTYFKIGTQLNEYTPPEDGELTCFSNDALGFNDYFYKHNNEGEIELTITKIK
jgi:hypothetical protein